MGGLLHFSIFQPRFLLLRINRMPRRLKELLLQPRPCLIRLDRPNRTSNAVGAPLRRRLPALRRCPGRIALIVVRKLCIPPDPRIHARREIEPVG